MALLWPAVIVFSFQSPPSLIWAQITDLGGRTVAILPVWWMILSSSLWETAVNVQVTFSTSKNVLELFAVNQRKFELLKDEDNETFCVRWPKPKITYRSKWLLLTWVGSLWKESKPKNAAPTLNTTNSQASTEKDLSSRHRRAWSTSQPATSTEQTRKKKKALLMIQTIWAYLCNVVDLLSSALFRKLCCNFRFFIYIFLYIDPF